MPKEVDTLKESSKPERSSGYAKRAAAALHLMKPTSSVEANITGGSAIHGQPKQETSTATSKNYTFRKGIVPTAFQAHLSKFQDFQC